MSKFPTAGLTGLPIFSSESHRCSHRTSISCEHDV